MEHGHARASNNFNFVPKLLHYLTMYWCAYVALFSCKNYQLKILFFRLGNVRNSHRLRGLRIVSASNTNPSEQDAPTEKGDGGAQGPPFLTILAGVVVFLLICWVVGSIVMWLIGLIVNVRSS